MISSDDFQTLLLRHGDRVYNLAYRWTGNEQDARDLTQEAFVRAYNSRDRFDESRPFEAWVFQIVRNLFLDLVKRVERKSTFSLDQPMPGQDSTWQDVLSGKDRTPIESLEKEEQERLLTAALQALPVPYRVAVTLCDLDGLSYQQISEIMECPIGTVRSRIFEGRKRIHQLMVQAMKKGGLGHV